MAFKFRSNLSGLQISKNSLNYLNLKIYLEAIFVFKISIL
ncbi:hypothetical protein UNSWCD_755 [Campylobacter concisus UNSWCD]|nr:hypothetical protein UNSWCD_755 [Campylobacter concisus UNSWCD]